MWTHGLDGPFKFLMVMGFLGIIGSLAGVIYLIYWLFTHIKVV